MAGDSDSEALSNETGSEAVTRNNDSAGWDGTHFTNIGTLTVGRPIPVAAVW